MQEDFLHYLWKYALFTKPLKINDGTLIEVQNPGLHNNDAGPDFFNAKIKIGDTVWAGNVEMHLKASDWFKHGHHNDDAYDNIILHVVTENDVEIRRQNGELIPVVELKAPHLVYEQYVYLMQSNKWVPCENFISKVNTFTIFEWKQALMIERLSTKAQIIERRWLATNKNWEESFYQTLAANFGFKINAVPFEMLSKFAPLAILSKHKDQLQLIEAMLFGVAGLLPENPIDDYSGKLIQDFKHLKNKFKLQTLKPHLWKFSKMRPSNFPTIRIAQLAALIHQNSGLMSKIIEAGNFNEVHKWFELEVSEYWQSHYIFGKESATRNKNFGNSAFENVIINSVAPFFALYAKIKDQAEYSEKAIDWLGQIHPEQNHITKHWSQLGVENKNAFDSQSLIQLKNIYCNARKCLYCRIGNQVIQYKF